MGIWRTKKQVSISGKHNLETMQTAFRNRVFLITGGSSGIGLASTKVALSYGAQVIISARHKDKLKLIAKELQPLAEVGGGSIDCFACDISDLEQCDQLVDYIQNKYQYVDVLFNNAGHSIRRSIHLSFDRFHDLQRTMQLNYFGAARIILGLLPTMVERQQGQILHSSSMGTMSPTPRFGPYLASKCALDAFMDSLAAEYADRHIYVTSIKFPLVKTPMITPTKAYRETPAESTEFAAQMFVDAVIDHPRVKLTPTGTLMGAVNLLSPLFMTNLYNLGYRVWPDRQGAYPELESKRKWIKRLIPKPPL